MPKGGLLQFRYQIDRWIAPDVQSAMNGNTLKGQTVLICYIDQTTQDVAPSFIPCRFAVIEDVIPHGTTASVRMRLTEFAHAEDLDGFNREITANAKAPLPHWVDGKLSGAYFLTTAELHTAKRSLELAQWERTVAQLAQRSQFSSEPAFYVVHKVAAVDTGTAVDYDSGAYTLSAETAYEISIYHYSPTTFSGHGSLTLASSSDALEIVTNHSLEFDTRYDMKRVRFVTSDDAKAQQCVLSVFRRVGNVGEEGSLDFDLEVHVRANIVKAVTTAILLGGLIAAPQILAALINPQLSAKRVGFLMLAYLVGGLGVGVVAAFRVTKKV